MADLPCEADAAYERGRADERRRILLAVNQMKRELWSGNGYMWVRKLAELLSEAKP